MTSQGDLSSLNHDVALQTVCGKCNSLSHMRKHNLGLKRTTQNLPDISNTYAVEHAERRQQPQQQMLKQASNLS